MNAKKPRDQGELWTKVVRRAKKKGGTGSVEGRRTNTEKGLVPSKRMPINRIKPPRPEAILIKPKKGGKYAEVLCGIKGKVKPDEMDVTIERIRETRQGGPRCLRERAQEKDIFEEALRRTVGDTGSVRGLTPRSQIENKTLTRPWNQKKSGKLLWPPSVTRCPVTLK